MLVTLRLGRVIMLRAVFYQHSVPAGTGHIALRAVFTGRPSSGHDRKCLMDMLG
ncbi:MAG: hypothetical protein LBJ01_11195 [Tannerella sp.]|jgi:hypothetical protein|nr:hypothetical protein [Tannerella sp.]